jgi:hypothetical protein
MQHFTHIPAYIPNKLKTEKNKTEEWVVVIRQTEERKEEKEGTAPQYIVDPQNKSTDKGTRLLQKDSIKVHKPRSFPVGWLPYSPSAAEFPVQAPQIFSPDITIDENV